MAGCFEFGDETSVSNATELVSITGQKVFMCLYNVIFASSSPSSKWTFSKMFLEQNDSANIFLIFPIRATYPTNHNYLDICAL